MVDGHGWNEVKEENARNACRTTRQATDHSAFRGVAQEARAGGQHEGGPARRPGQRTARAAHRLRANCGRDSQPGERRRSRAILRGHIETRSIPSLSAPSARQTAKSTARRKIGIRDSARIFGTRRKTCVIPIANAIACRNYRPHSGLAAQFIDLPMN
ncbi:MULTISPECIES: hypothetical protein [Burkholderia]|uniref:hypothetical protein n=1 Tax=Burkholderia TaxID=32008 RepID=UPI000AA573AD|nr:MULTISPECIES: hypothetical protein [Burkholderia]